MTDDVSPEEVIKIRTDRDWSQMKLAEYLGCNQSTVWRIENGAKINGPMTKALLVLRDAPLDDSADEMTRIRQAAAWIAERSGKPVKLDDVVETVAARFKLTAVQAAHALAEAKLQIARGVL